MHFSEFFKSIKKDYTHLREDYYKRNKGAEGVYKNAEYLKWDKLHQDVEVFNRTGEHLGSLDPLTKALYKGSKHRPIKF